PAPAHPRRPALLSAVTSSGSRLTWRMATLIFVLALALVGVVGRLVMVQLLDHDRYTAEALAEHMDKQEIRSTRGAIPDRNGFPLATSIDAWDVYLDRRAFRADAPGRPDSVANALAPLLNEQKDQLM